MKYFRGEFHYSQALFIIKNVHIIFYTSNELIHDIGMDIAMVLGVQLKWLC